MPIQAPTHSPPPTSNRIKTLSHQIFENSGDINISKLLRGSIITRDASMTEKRRQKQKEANSKARLVNSSIRPKVERGAGLIAGQGGVLGVRAWISTEMDSVHPFEECSLFYSSRIS